MKKGVGKRVYVGLSGGVDSSVSALLLKEAGYDVTGVFIEVWQPDFMPCSQESDRQDAKRIAAQLNIPFTTLDLKDEYKKEVVDEMVAAYARGETPNPDILCNRSIKFGAFYEWARHEGAHFVATGHYAQIAEENGKHFLKTSVDTAKDQTYFLWTLQGEQLPHILFPVGGMTKSKTREIAKKNNLVTAQKHDSQGICFLGAVDMKEFLSHFIGSEKGAVLNEMGEIIGEHDGALFYTLGQRHGFLVHAHTTNTKPLYVVSKDMAQNTITVLEEPKGFAKEKAAKSITLSSCNWISDTPKEGEEVLARLRHRQEFFAGVLTNISTTTAQFTFSTEPQLAAKGQSLVLYKNGICLGGGIIDD